MERGRAQVRLTVGAEQDIAGIHRRKLAQRRPDGADALLDRLVTGIEGLADYTERGPLPPELQDLGITAYRHLSLPPYRVIYLPEGEMVTVLIVADSRRDFRTLLEERLIRR